jgi:hypothetical protein
MNFQSDQSLCDCGSGLPGDECCANQGCKIIYFSVGKKNHYYIDFTNAVLELLEYARRNFHHWEPLARSRFLSLSHTDSLDAQFNYLFVRWYAINFRFHNQGLPIIDLYMEDKQIDFDERLRPVFNALRSTFPSIYQVVWIKHNTICIEDIFCGDRYLIERQFGEFVRNSVETGDLLLARIAQYGNVDILLNKPIVIDGQHKSYLQEEVNSFLHFKSLEGDARILLRQNGEVIVGLVIDLFNGVKKSGPKVRSLRLNKGDTRKAVKAISGSRDFSLLERDDDRLKLSWDNEQGCFNRLYIFAEGIVAISEDLGELEKFINKIETTLGRDNQGLEWHEGYNGRTETEIEDILVEIVHDKYIEEWINTPQLGLDNLTPLQANKDLKGKILLLNLLERWELMEMRAHAKGEYYLPTAVIRKKLSLDQNKLVQEYLKPDILSARVAALRAHQKASPFIIDYIWVKDEYKKVAEAAFDLYAASSESADKLAWMLFMWNEFVHIYQPRVSTIYGWMAALEFTFLECRGTPAVCKAMADKYRVSSWTLSRNAQLMVRHFKKYPLLFNKKIASYPQWEDIKTAEMISAYEEVLHQLQLYAYNMKTRGLINEGHSRNDFFTAVNSDAKYFDENISHIYERFFKEYFYLDAVNNDLQTIANLFWDSQACRFPNHIKTAVLNIMMSYIGAYTVIPVGTNQLIFRDIFTGQQLEGYGRFSNNCHQDIVDNMIVITRMLPVHEMLWVDEPMFIVMPDLALPFKRNLDMLMERVENKDHSDLHYLKQRGEKLLKSYVMALDEAEQEALYMMKQPLQMYWQCAEISDRFKIASLLQRNRRFRPIQQGTDGYSFLWDQMLSGNNQWGYVLIRDDIMLVSVPPGKEWEKLFRDIRRTLKTGDIIISFSRLEANLFLLDELQGNFINDLSNYFRSEPGQLKKMLTPDFLGNDEEEWKQGIYMLKLGRILSEHLNTADYRL